MKYLWDLAKDFQFEHDYYGPVPRSEPFRRLGINLILNTCALEVEEIIEGPRPSDLERNDL